MSVTSLKTLRNAHALVNYCGLAPETIEDSGYKQLNQANTYMWKFFTHMQTLSLSHTQCIHIHKHTCAIYDSWYRCTHTHTHTHTHMHTYKHMWTNPHNHIHMNTNTQTHTQIHTQTYTNAHTHTHTLSLKHCAQYIFRLNKDLIHWLPPNNREF